jgi:acyl carrier protein
MSANRGKNVMSLGDGSKEKAARLSGIATMLSTPEQVLRAMDAQNRRPRPELEEEFVPPNGPTEELLSEIYAQALGLDRIGVMDNFFKLGGNSLTIVQMASHIRDRFGVELPMETFFKSPTVASLAISVIQGRSAGLGAEESDRLLDMLDRLSDEEVEGMLAKLESGETGSSLSSPGPARSFPDSNGDQSAENRKTHSSERYRPARLEAVPLGGNRHWIYSWENHKSRVTDSNVAALLSGGGKFELVENLISILKKDSDGTPEISKARVEDLISDGFLISEREVLLSLARTPQRAPAPLRISTIGCVTCDRPAGAERAVASCIQHCRSYERSPRFVVVDDTTELKNGDECRGRLRAQRDEHEAEIYYAGAGEKKEYLQLLVDRFELPKDTLEFALFGLGRGGVVSPGKNRNALLLETLDEGVFSLDDDTVCTVMAATKRRGGLRIQSGPDMSGMDPSEVWSLHDRELAGKIPPPAEIDIVGCHEAYLGREVSERVSSAYGKEEVDIEQAAADLPHRLKKYGGRIRVTLNGLLGDCGWGSPFPYLMLEADSFARLTRSEPLYQKILTSRDILRVTVNTVITDRTKNLMSTFLGYDNHGILPPFVPVGRGSDYIFALVLSKCYRDNFYAHLPYALIHSPFEKRSFWPGEIQRGAIGIDFASLIGAFINSFELGDGHGDEGENLIKLGRRLEQLGELPEAGFAELSRVLVCKQTGDLIEELEKRLQRQSESAEFWAKDVKKYLSSLSQRMSRPGIAVPLDLLYGRSLDEAQRLAQRAVRGYGRLLGYWPAIVQSCRELKGQGISLAQAV